MNRQFSEKQNSSLPHNQTKTSYSLFHSPQVGESQSCDSSGLGWKVGGGLWEMARLVEV